MSPQGAAASGPTSAVAPPGHSGGAVTLDGERHPGCRVDPRALKLPPRSPVPAHLLRAMDGMASQKG